MPRESSPELREFQWIGFAQSALTGILTADLTHAEDPAGSHITAIQRPNSAWTNDVAVVRAGVAADAMMAELARRDFSGDPEEN